MTDAASTNPWATRWDALRAENGVLDREQLELLSSFTPPFSLQQIAQLEAAATRRGNLVGKMRVLVDDWTDHWGRSRP